MQAVPLSIFSYISTIILLNSRTRTFKQNINSIDRTERAWHVIALGVCVGIEDKHRPIIIDDVRNNGARCVVRVSKI